MSDRIDHAAEARRIMADGQSAVAHARDAAHNGNHRVADGYGAKAHGCWMQAQVHATLALVEQQRIVNLITVAGWVVDSSTEDVGYDLDKLRTGVAGEVWEALGLGVAVSEIFEWDGRGSAMILTEHEHVHQDGRCVKNRYDVACSTPRGRWTGGGVA